MSDIPSLGDLVMMLGMDEVERLCAAKAHVLAELKPLEKKRLLYAVLSDAVRLKQVEDERDT